MLVSPLQVLLEFWNALKPQIPNHSRKFIISNILFLQQLIFFLNRTEKKLSQQTELLGVKIKTNCTTFQRQAEN